MKISVVVCTHNRSGLLTAALNSVATSVLPEAVEWEVIVVDNNSTDQTQSVVEGFCERYPDRFRYVFEPRPGKSFALNSGIEHSRGDVLAFMDDDEIVSPTWLQNLTRHLDHGPWAGAGGRVLLPKEFFSPKWLPVDVPAPTAPLAAFDLGPDDSELTMAPSGNNMAYRKGVFAEFGGFRTDLGPRPGTREPKKCEDTEFGWRLLRAGKRLRYESAAIAVHPVSEDRLQKSYFLHWWFDNGRSEIRALGLPADHRYRIVGVPAVLFRRLIMETLRWVVTFKPSRRFSRKIGIWYNAGVILECHRLARAKEERESPQRNLNSKAAAEQVLQADTSLRR